MGFFDTLFGGYNNPPIVPKLPQYETQFTNKWQTLKPMVDAQGIDPNVAQSIYAMDRTRLTTGQAPLSQPDTARALLSAQAGHTITPSPQRSIWDFPGNVMHDVRNIAQSVFKIPQMVYEEAAHVPEIPGAIAKATQTATSPWNEITNLTQVPGIRMIPGAYDVGQLARGPSGFKELATHPVMAALDALPGVSKLAEGSAVARAAEEAFAITKTVNPETGLPNTLPIDQARLATKNPVKAVMLNKLTDDGALTRNAFGELVDTTAASQAGTWAKAAFAPASRAASVAKNYWDAALQQSLNPDLNLPARFRAVQALVDTTRDASNLSKSFPEMSDSNWLVDTHDKMSVGDWAGMDDRQTLYANKIRDIGNRYEHYSAAVGWTKNIDGEIYPTDVANRILAARDDATWARSQSEVLNHMMNPTLDPQQYVNMAREELSRTDISGYARRQRASAYLRAADGMGMDLGDTISRLHNMPLEDHAIFDIPNPSPTVSNADIEAVRAAPSSTGAGGYGAVMDAQLPKTPGTHVMDDGAGGKYIGIRDSTGKLSGYLMATDDAVSTFENLSGTRGIGQQLLKALSDSGTDVPALLRNSDFTDTGRAAAIRYLESNPRVTPRPPIANLLTELSRYRNSTRIGELKESLSQGQWGRASGIIRDVLTQKRELVPGLGDYLPTLEHLFKRDKLALSTSEDGFANFTDKAVTAKEAYAEKLAANHAPARYGPMIEQAAYSEVVNRVTDPARRAQILQDLMQHNYADLGDVLPGGKSELFAMAEEISQNWKQFQRFDPVFVHRVAPEAIGKSNFPKISEVLRTPSAIKERTWDFSPHVHDASIAMKQQGLEYLQRYASEAFIDEMIKRFGRTRSEVEPLVRERAIQLGLTGDPRYANYETAVAHLLKSQWTGFNPKAEGYFWDSQKLKSIADGDYMLPKHIADNLEAWHNPKSTIIKAALDPIMKVFRVALLPLSLSWHIHSIVGSAVVSTAESPGMLRYLGDAYHMIKTGDLPDYLKSRAEEYPEGLQLSRRSERGLYSEIQMMEGRTFGRVLQDAQSDRLNKLGAVIEHPGDLMATVRDKFNKVVDKSYTFNGMIHDLFRSASYLYGEDKAFKTGTMTAEESARVGMELADKILPHFAELTPTERSVMRYVFPFYGWMNFIGRYALRYPFDHPLRASIMAGISRNALQDLGADGLPESFLTANFFGHRRADGSQAAWRTNQVNPFASLATRFTLVGLMSATNPVLASIVDQLGVSKGHLEAYPNLAFDPQTGRLGATSPGLLQSFAGHLIPQSAFFTALAGVNTEFKDTVRRDPEAARRMIEQSIGIPIPYRTYNIAQEIAKREIAVHQGQSLAQHQQLLTGDLSGSEYPQLQTYFTKLSELPQSTLAQFQATPASISEPGTLASLQSNSISSRARIGGL